MVMRSLFWNYHCKWHAFRHFIGISKSVHFLNKWIGTLLIMFRSLQIKILDFWSLDPFPILVVKPALFPILTKGFFFWKIKVTEYRFVLNQSYSCFNRLVLNRSRFRVSHLTYWKNATLAKSDRSSRHGYRGWISRDPIIAQTYRDQMIGTNSFLKYATRL